MDLQVTANSEFKRKSNRVILNLNLLKLGFEVWIHSMTPPEYFNSWCKSIYRRNIVVVVVTLVNPPVVPVLDRNRDNTL